MTISESLADKIRAEGASLEWHSSGYGCLMLRTPLLSWCGYVAVPAEHPWHGLQHNARVTPLPERSIPDGIVPNVFGVFLEALSDAPDDGLLPLDLVIAVHGGITWSAPRCELRGQSADRTEWLFGFDCGHAGDLVPGVAALLLPPNSNVFADSVYRDRDYVFGETSRLAAQLRMAQERGYR